MYIGDIEKKIFHTSQCEKVKEINHQTFFFLEAEALKEHYHYCSNCAAVMAYYHQDRQNIDNFVNDYHLSFHFNNQDGTIDVMTRYSRWKLYASSRGLSLYHHNEFATDFDESTKIKDYHRQHVHKESIIDYLQYIISHDAFRKNNPYEPPQTMKDRHLTKNSKKYRKEQRHIRKIKGKITARKVNELLRDLHK